MRLFEMGFFIAALAGFLLLLDVAVHFSVLLVAIKEVHSAFAAYIPFSFALCLILVSFAMARMRSPNIKRFRKRDDNEQLVHSQYGSHALELNLEDIFAVDTVFPEVTVTFEVEDGQLKLASIELHTDDHTSIGADQVRADVQFCTLCGVPKFPGTSHCDECQRCVLAKDHHCSWLACCVGSRNYYAFLLFVISAIVLLAVSLANAFLAIDCAGKQGKMLKTLVYAASLTITVLALPILAFALYLLVYHIHLLFISQTTRSLVRGSDAVRCYGDIGGLKQVICKTAMRRNENHSRRSLLLFHVPNLSKGEFAHVVERAFAWSLLLCGWCDNELV